MKEIILYSGGKTQVSDEDFIYLSYWFWHISDQGYVRRTEGKTTVLMHKTIAERMGLKGKTDHKDRNKLNNQRENLRSATSLQNNQNANVRSDNKSGYKGVCFHKKTNKWRAQIRVTGQKKHLGLFNTAKEAAQAYNVAAQISFGDFAVLNHL